MTAPFEAIDDTSAISNSSNGTQLPPNYKSIKRDLKPISEPIKLKSYIVDGGAGRAKILLRPEMGDCGWRVHQCNQMADDARSACLSP
jgi:hypothetical protein